MHISLDRAQKHITVLRYVTLTICFPCFARPVDVFHGKYAYCVVVSVYAAGPDVQARQYIGLMY